MENIENNNVEQKSHRCHFTTTISIIAIILSIISIALSAFTLGTMYTRKHESRNNKDRNERIECPMRDSNGCKMNGRNSGRPTVSDYTPEFDRPSFESGGPSKSSFNMQGNDNRPSSNEQSNDRPNLGY